MTQYQSDNSDDDWFYIVLAVLGLDLTLTGLICFIQTKLNPLGEVISFWNGVQLFVETLPLTLAVMIVVALYRSGELSLTGFFVTLIGCGLVAHLLHLGVNKLEGGGNSFPPPLPTKGGLWGILIEWSFGFITAYYHGYGKVLFFKSCILGFSAGTKLGKRGS